MLRASSRISSQQIAKRTRILGLPLVWVAYKHWRYYKNTGCRIEEATKGAEQGSGPFTAEPVELGHRVSHASKVHNGGTVYPGQYDVRR